MGTRVKSSDGLHVKQFTTTGAVKSGAVKNNTHTVNTMTVQLVHLVVGGKVKVLFKCLA